MSVQGPDDNTMGEPPPELNHSHKVAGTRPGETPSPSALRRSRLCPPKPLTPTLLADDPGTPREASSPASMEPGLPDPALRVGICNDQVSPGAALHCPLWPACPHFPRRLHPLSPRAPPPPNIRVSEIRPQGHGTLCKSKQN